MKKRMNQIVCAFLVTLFCFSFHSLFSIKVGAITVATREFISMQQATLSDLYNRIRSMTISVSYGSLIYRDTEDLLTHSNIIAIGTVTGKSKSYEVIGTKNSKNIYTDTYFTITNALKGKPYAETVSIRQEGGSIGTHTAVAESEPKLEIGKEYLIFLYNSNCGGIYETDDDYYQIYGLSQGTFEKSDDGEFYNIKTHEPVPAEVFISPHLDEEVDENYFRKERAETYRLNYENGIDTLEEYEANMRGLDEYGTKIPRE